MLEAAADDVWTWRRSDQDRVKIALPDNSFVVILKERPAKAFLKTAFYIERPSRREQFRREYEQAEKR